MKFLPLILLFLALPSFAVQPNCQNTGGALDCNPTSVPGVQQTTATAVQGISGGIPLTVSGTVETVSPSTSGSSSITTGGTSQVLFSGTTPVNGWKVSLPVTLANTSNFVCYVSDEITNPGAAVSGSYPIYAGGQYSTEVGQKPIGPVYLNCPTTGTPFSAQKW